MWSVGMSALRSSSLSILDIMGLVSSLEERDGNGNDELRERTCQEHPYFWKVAYRPLYSLDSSSNWRDGYACNGLSDALITNLVPRLLSPWHERFPESPTYNRYPRLRDHSMTMT